jgi:hypothetical protein
MPFVTGGTGRHVQAAAVVKRAGVRWKVQNHNRDRQERRELELAKVGEDEAHFEDIAGEMPP